MRAVLWTCAWLALGAAAAGCSEGRDGALHYIDADVDAEVDLGPDAEPDVAAEPDEGAGDAEVDAEVDAG